MTKREAILYRRAIVRGSESIPDGQAAQAPMLFDRWESGVRYAAGTRLYYGGKLYKVLQEHESQETWTPDTAPSLYARVLIPDPGEIPEWVQPDSTNAYSAGDKVRHAGKTWESTINNNVWEPGTVEYWVEI